MTIQDTIDEIRIIDNHAHPVEPLETETVRDSFSSFFTEGALSANHARHTLNYRAALELLDEQFGESTTSEFSTDETTLLARRAEVDTETYTRELIAETNTEIILADNGFPDVSPKEFQSYTDADVHPIVRIEPIIESLYEEYAEFGAFESAFDAALEDALAGSAVALKTIVAYRTGLAVGTPDRQAARDAFATLEDRWTGRIEEPAMLEYLVDRACQLAGERNVPVQFHTGFGDPDAHPRQVDPTLLADLIQRHPTTPIVLLHAGYPYVRQSGYVTATYENAYLDLSLALPFIQHGCEDMLSAVLELAPTTKLLYGSDAFSVPELYVLAARRIRDDLATVLESLVAEGFINHEYAETIAHNVLRENAIRLYDL